MVICVKFRSAGTTSPWWRDGLFQQLQLRILRQSLFWLRLGQTGDGLCRSGRDRCVWTRLHASASVHFQYHDMAEYLANLARDLLVWARYTGYATLRVWR